LRIIQCLKNNAGYYAYQMAVIKFKVKICLGDMIKLIHALQYAQHHFDDENALTYFVSMFQNLLQKWCGGRSTLADMLEQIIEGVREECLPLLTPLSKSEKALTIQSKGQELSCVKFTGVAEKSAMLCPQEKIVQPMQSATLQAV